MGKKLDRVPPASDPFWVDYTFPLANYLEGGRRTWQDLRAWAKQHRMPGPMLLESIAWLSMNRATAWDELGKTWTLEASVRVIEAGS